MYEEIISLKTAKLAKKVGYISTDNDITSEKYLYQDQVWNIKEHQEKNKNDIYYYERAELDKNEYEACSQSTLQRWIRENHNIHIIIEYSSSLKKYSHMIYLSDADKVEIELTKLSVKLKTYYKFKTYEEALETALFESLKLIKDGK